MTLDSALRAARALLLVAALLPAPLAAQGGAGGHAELTVGSELERYLRALQLTGAVPLHPWSVRGFSPAEGERLRPVADHVWRDRLPGADSAPARALAIAPIEADLRFNSAFPYGWNDHAVWAGRGLTASVSAGAALRAGPLTVRLAPTAFVAENRGFPLMETGREGRLAFGDPIIPIWIDLPQRFGDDRVVTFDPGQSEVRLDVAGLAAGLSTSSQAWGPALHQPLILGWNAPGFPHAFAGTAAPANIGIGRVHGRVIWGRLAQSDFSPARADRTVRFATGAAVAFVPRFAPGLEIGATRFFHLPWREGGPTGSDFAKLFEVLEKRRLLEEDSLYVGAEDNQLASVFFRWALPGVGVEAYGEFAREDHSYDLLDLTLEPDHSSAYTLGAQKVWAGRPDRMVVARGEVLNARRPQLSIGRIQLPYYVHPGRRQGHTHRGQVLGAPFAKGGGGSVVGVDVYRPGGRFSVEWTRWRVAEAWTMHPTRWPPPLPPQEPGRSDTDVIHALGGDGVLFRGRFELTGGASLVMNLNRYFERDVFNLHARVGARLRL